MSYEVNLVFLQRANIVLYILQLYIVNRFIKGFRVRGWKDELETNEPSSYGSSGLW